MTRAAQASFNGWPPEALEWFGSLGENNNREWFQANRSTYENAVRGPMLALLDEVSGEFGVGKVSRPNRDIRFSPDRSPYKLQIYAVVPHPGGPGAGICSSGATVFSWEADSMVPTGNDSTVSGRRSPTRLPAPISR